MPKDLFQFIENIFSKKEFIDSKEVFKENYMTIKFLSLYPGTFYTAAEANRLSTKIPYWAVNSFLFHSVEKQRPPRIQYPKGTKEEKKYPKEAIQKICQKCCCSEDHAVQILNILSLKDDKILLSLGIGKEGENSGKKNRRVSKKKFPPG